MEEFNSLYPNVRFKILNNSTTESVNAVKEGKVDLAFVSANLQVAKPLRMKILRKYHDILISGNRFGELKDDGKEVSLKELVSYPWISLTAETITRRFLNEYFEKNSLTIYTGYGACNDGYDTSGGKAQSGTWFHPGGICRFGT